MDNICCFSGGEIQIYLRLVLKLIHVVCLVNRIIEFW